METIRHDAGVEISDANRRSLYRIAAVGGLLAFSANVLDVVLGFGETDLVAYGNKSAVDWFALYRENWFKGIYTLGFLNIVYMICLVPVYFALVTVHRRKNGIYALMAMVVFLTGMAVYVSNNAAIPMFVLSGKYVGAQTDAQRIIIAGAGEAVLASGEDFTPGSFIGLILGGIAAIGMSTVMLRGGIFGKKVAWVGIVGFTFLSIFTVWSTFIPVLYEIAFYLFGMIGGLLALTWFVSVSPKLFKLGRTEESSA